MRSAVLLPLLLCAALPACASRPSSAPPAPQVPEGGGGPRLDIESRIDVTPSAVHATILNHTETDLVFRTSVRVIGADWKDAVPPLTGPDVPVKASTTSAPWSIALPPLPDGYLEVQVSATPTQEGFLDTGANGYFRVERGVVTVIDFGEWHNKTGGAPITPLHDESPP
ncbi:hypothetical protein [Nannocystis sp. SCPEA4]|uniref:hypothetical protein n=1 Tax=Nannocystis sp. SCPEA4 TaxID=2996787 RepID=UPI002270D649|nr:hypothetical protein [Nannocystis sp. SCPEA4]MCY1060920.1 hypothetical protein [Nannocystis sp. SCPEA4]